MRKVITSRMFLGTALILFCLSIASYAAYRKTETIDAEAPGCTQTPQVPQEGELLWETLSRQFVSSVLYR